MIWQTLFELFFRHSDKMEPRLLLQWLLDRDGDNANSLSIRLNGKPSQPQLHKFLHGIAREPRRSTPLPVATHYRVPIDAFYDERVADATMRQLTANGTPGQQIAAASTQPAQQATAAMPAECQVICNMFADLPVDQRLRNNALAEIIAVIQRAKDPPSHQARPGTKTGTDNQ